MKKVCTPLALVAAAALSAQTYDTTFTGASGTDYNWSNSANWSNGVPTESSNILIESEGLSNNNLNLGDDVVKVGSVVWNVVGSQARQRSISGTLKADSMTINGGNFFSQFWATSNATLDITNAAGTGVLTLNSENNLYFKMPLVKADYLNVNKNATIEDEAGGSFVSPKLLVNKVATLNDNGRIVGTGTSANSELYMSFGGLAGTGTINGASNANAAKGYIEFTNTAKSRFDGKILLSDSSFWGGGSNKEIHLVMNGSSVQEFSNSASTISSVTVNSGEVSMVAQNAGALYLHGGKLSVFNDDLAQVGNALNADSLAWGAGTVKLGIGLSGNDSIALSGALSKSGSGDLKLELVFADGVAQMFEELGEDLNAEYTLISYGTNEGVAAGDVSVIAPSGFKYTLNFGENALTLNVSAVPEPAIVAAILGALALGLAVYRRRK